MIAVSLFRRGVSGSAGEKAEVNPSKIRPGSIRNIASIGSMSGEKAAQALHSYMGYAALGEVWEVAVRMALFVTCRLTTPARPPAMNPPGHVPSFTGVEIGGGRITGTEISEEHPEGISFGMYHG